jgi:hypothetical protein
MLRPIVTSDPGGVGDGTAFTVADLAALTISTTGSVYSASRGGRAGPGTSCRVRARFPGHAGGIRQAALILAKTWLTGQRSPIDDRATTFASTDGGTYALAVPGRNGSTFGIPDVDAVIDRYDLRVGIA